jgi:hypothetical protein
MLLAGYSPEWQLIEQKATGWSNPGLRVIGLVMAVLGGNT